MHQGRSRWTRSTGFHRTLALVVVAVALNSVAAVALTEEEAFAHLESVNADVFRAFTLLPKQYGVDPDGELRRIEEADALIRAAVDSIRGEHKAAEEQFAVVQANLARLRGQIDVARTAQAASVAMARVRARHASGIPAPDADLAAYGAAVATLSQVATPEWRQTASYFERALTADRQEAERIRFGAVQNAGQAQAAAFVEAQKRAQAALIAVQSHFAGAPGVPPAEQMKALLAAANQLVTFDVGAAGYYLRQHRAAERAAVFRALEGKAIGIEAAGLYEGANVVSGSLKQSKLTQRIRADKDWCYLMVLRSPRPLPVLLVEKLEVSATKVSAVQRFTVAPDMPGGEYLEGFCTTDAVTVTVKGLVDAADKLSPIPFVVVGWPRADAPLDAFIHVALRRPHPCDATLWSRLWVDPVPGTLAYRGDEAVLLASSSVAPNGPVSVWSFDGTESALPRGEVRNTPSGPPRLLPPGGQRCQDPAAALGKNAQAIAKCYAKVDKTFEKKRKKADKDREKAITSREIETAEEALLALTTKQESDRETKCGSELTAWAKAADQSRDEVVARFAGGAPAPGPVDRAGALLAELAAAPR